MSRAVTAGPIAAAIRTLLDWLSLAGIPAVISPPSVPTLPAGPATAPGENSAPLTAWPIGILSEQQVRDGHGSAPLPMRLRFLLATDPTSGAQVDLLDRVLVASLQDGAVHTPVEPVTVDVWQAFGLPPRLGLYADVRTVASIPPPTPPRVRHPLRLESLPLARIHGTVIGPGGIPVPGVRVSAAGMPTVHTDDRGRFSLPSLSVGGPTRLLLSCKGFDLVAEATPSDEPLVIHCDIQEV
jgi:hypothetical protein